MDVDDLDGSDAFSAERVRITTADGYNLGGAFLVPTSGPRVALALHCGAGIAAIRYRRIARFLACGGVSVLLYDYRGIGWSAPHALRGFQARVEDWSEFDVAAANFALADRFPGVPLVGLAHSVAALLLLGSPNADLYGRLVFVAPHTGYVGDYRFAYRMPMAVLWHVLMPALTKAFGYFPARALHLGEDIPAGVAMQWARRRRPHLLSGLAASDRARHLLMNAGNLCTTTTVITISDDAFATLAGARRLLCWAPHLVTVFQTVRPLDANAPKLGHFGYFTKVGAGLWGALLAQLLQPTASGT